MKPRYTQGPRHMQGSQCLHGTGPSSSSERMKGTQKIPSAVQEGADPMGVNFFSEMRYRDLESGRSCNR